MASQAAHNTYEQQQQHNNRRRNNDCPCKYSRPCNLSSVTAAEYGIVTELIHRDNQRRGQRRRRSNNNTPTTTTTTTPLHVAAQYGHIDVVQYLLLDTNTNNTNRDELIESFETIGYSPFHRSCYSGAVGTTVLLFNYFFLTNNVFGPSDVVVATTASTIPPAKISPHSIRTTATTQDTILLLRKNTLLLERILLQPDTSYGDYQTPLHKACMSGRYYIIQLLLQQSIRILLLSNNNTNQSSSPLSKSRLIPSSSLSPIEFLYTLYHAKDRDGKMPMDIAKEQYHLYQQQKHQQYGDYSSFSSSRWDIVAGDTQPDWKLCISILQYYYDQYLYQYSILKSSLYCLPIVSTATTTTSTSSEPTHFGHFVTDSTMNTTHTGNNKNINNLSKNSLVHTLFNNSNQQQTTVKQWEESIRESLWESIQLIVQQQQQQQQQQENHDRPSHNNNDNYSSSNSILIPSTTGCSSNNTIENPDNNNSSISNTNFIKPDTNNVVVATEHPINNNTNTNKVQEVVTTNTTNTTMELDDTSTTIITKADNDVVDKPVGGGGNNGRQCSNCSCTSIVLYPIQVAEKQSGGTTTILLCKRCKKKKTKKM